ncbi:MAG: hypothetical protein AB7J30_05600 [Hyphomicrobium sp.]|uniref:hypothetical protein n=1 Tax=Hyphomicrobium sp. TaxID=82 RepID=UPI003D14B4D4
MTDTNFPLAADGDFDDLPRTLRREKEARAREARERRERESRSMDGNMVGDPPSYLARTRPSPGSEGELTAASVERFDVPFHHLVMFFLKCAIAAVPALVLLGALFFFGSKALEVFYPELLRMKILITFTGG